MADNMEAAEVLRRQRDIERALAAARAADIALLGIGDLHPTTSGFAAAGFITPAELTDLVAAGAVGDMAGQIYTLTGKLHPCPYNRRVIGLTLEELKQIPITIAVAMGETKIKAILGGLRTGAINVFCTDHRTASAVLGLNQSSVTRLPNTDN
jgi:DNA-binding transcriptional regulator LsrR (DeoR family)